MIISSPLAHPGNNSAAVVTTLLYYCYCIIVLSSPRARGHVDALLHSSDWKHHGNVVVDRRSFFDGFKSFLWLDSQRVNAATIRNQTVLERNQPLTSERSLFILHDVLIWGYCGFCTVILVGSSALLHFYIY